MQYQAPQYYKNAQIQTSSPGELTLMLYNGCIRFLRQASDCIKRQDISGKHQFLLKANNILEELQITLNMDYEISSNLHSLYDFLIQQVSRANIHMDEQPLQICIELLTELRDTWSEALKQLKTGAHA